MSKTKQNERPILFQGEMVRAILKGTKTVTRRIIKPQDHMKGAEVDRFQDYEDGSYRAVLYPEKGGDAFSLKMPYGGPGDLLWVRESHYPIQTKDIRKGAPTVVFKADPSNPLVPKWIPSIHMKREFSRISLLVEEVGIERLQDITEKEAIAEGVERAGFDGWKDYDNPPKSDSFLGLDFARDSFRTLWNSINGSWVPISRKNPEWTEGSDLPKRIVIRYECYPWSIEDVPSIPDKDLRNVWYPWDTELNEEGKASITFQGRTFVAFPNPWIRRTKFRVWQNPKMFLGPKHFADLPEYAISVPTPSGNDEGRLWLRKEVAIDDGEHPNGWYIYRDRVVPRPTPGKVDIHHDPHIVQIWDGESVSIPERIGFHEKREEYLSRDDLFNESRP